MCTAWLKSGRSLSRKQLCRAVSFNRPNKALIGRNPLTTKFFTGPIKALRQWVSIERSRSHRSTSTCYSNRVPSLTFREREKNVYSRWAGSIFLSRMNDRWSRGQAVQGEEGVGWVTNPNFNSWFAVSALNAANSFNSRFISETYFKFWCSIIFSF